MSYPNDPTTFTVPLALEAHTRAQQFYRHQVEPDKARQVYLNALAVYAVHFYLECLSIETDLRASGSWHPVTQTLMNTAELMVKHRGKLECRPVLPDAATVFIPPEVWDDRIGYVAVELSESLREATLLGFLKKAASETVSLREFQSLDYLIEQLQVERLPATPASVRLSQWLHNLGDAGWQAIGDALNLINPPQPAFQFRGSSQAAHLTGQSSPLVQRRKQVTLGSPPNEIRLELVVGVLPRSQTEFQIWVQLQPTDEQTRLPPELELIVLDEVDTPILRSQAQSTKVIQLQFTRSLGEQFEIELVRQEDRLTEVFVV